MVTPVDPPYPKNMKNMYAGALAAGATLRLQLDPNARVAISVKKNGNSCTVDVAAQTRDAAGAITDLEDADIIWNSVSTGTTDYFKGDNFCLTGVRLINAAGVAVNYAVIQPSA